MPTSTLRSPVADRRSFLHAIGWPYPSATEKTATSSLDVEDSDDFSVDRTFKFQSATHHYKLYSPAQFDRPRGLVVMLHGCGQTASCFAELTKMNEAAELANCVVLYPEQNKSENSHGCWNWYQPEHQERGHGEPAWIAALARKVATKMDVDYSRIFIAGLSAGGTMAATVAEAYPELFAACAVHSAPPPRAAKGVVDALWTMRYGSADTACTSSTKFVPTIVLHGEDDTTVHPSHGRLVVERMLRLLSKRQDQRVVSHEVAVGTTAGRPGHNHRQFHNAQGQLLAEYWQIAGQGHLWSGERFDNTLRVSQAPDATQEILRFFAEVSAARA